MYSNIEWFEMADQQQPNEPHDGAMKSKAEQEQNDEKTSDKAAEVKTITNIYYDCLERIFDRLEFVDFLNLAQTCKRLQIAAAAKFSDDFSKRAELSLCDSEHHEYTIRSSSISISGTKACLPFLRCFGAKLVHLDVYYDYEYGEYEYVEKYINQYCAKTLQSISFYGKNYTYSVETFSVPFEKVAKIGMIGCEYGCEMENQLPNLVKWFPNLRHLDIRYTFIGHANEALNFPKLERLTIVERIPQMSTNTLLFRANPQLKYLDVALVRFTLTTLLDTISGNSAISHLKYFGKNEVVSRIEINRIASEHSSIEVLQLTRCYLALDDVAFLIGQLKSLERFQCCTKTENSNYDRLLAQIGDEWKGEIDGDFIEICRKKTGRAGLQSNNLR